MNKLSGFLYTGTQIGTIERRAADIADLDSWTLMQRAGQCAFQLLQAEWPKARSMTVWCGAGNNGGIPGCAGGLGGRGDRFG
jgi:NAD(P)H-hydrate repair Nnr-like enzyme with NAD(P)H-hydrate epimerase domain